MYTLGFYMFLTALTAPHSLPFAFVRLIVVLTLLLGVGENQDILLLPLMVALEILEQLMMSDHKDTTPERKVKPKHRPNTRKGDTYNIQMGVLIDDDSDSDVPESDEQGRDPRPNNNNIAEEPTPDGSDTETESHYEARMNAAAAPRV